MEEIFEEGVVNLSALGMVLDRESEGIITQTHLLDDIIVGAPGFDFETVCQPIDGLMMRTVYIFESMLGLAVVTQ